MWFEKLTGFCEENPQQVRAGLSIDGTLLKSTINGKSWVCGELTTPSLAELRALVDASNPPGATLSLQEVVADSQSLHADESNAGALFQVASQFNLLEMVSPWVTPEAGLDGYEMDLTQGPACAIAAGAGTIYRHYFTPLDGQIGQSKDKQIDCLAELGEALGHPHKQLWTMRNGYALASHAGLVDIAGQLQGASEAQLDELRGRLRIGIQWHTQVTLGEASHLVSQAYCSALPVAYSEQPANLWEPFARLVLEASYEATLCAAILNALQSANKRVFLTCIGGGAFGNRRAWIIAAIRRALARHRQADLEVSIVSYGHSREDIRALVDDWNRSHGL